MDMKGFKFDESGDLQMCAASEAVASWRGGGGPFWIDVASGDPDTTREGLKSFGISSFMLERCLSVGNATQIIPSPDAVYLEISV